MFGSMLVNAAIRSESDDAISVYFTIYFLIIYYLIFILFFYIIITILKVGIEFWKRLALSFRDGQGDNPFFSPDGAARCILVDSEPKVVQTAQLGDFA
jgi:hypothetical protein